MELVRRLLQHLACLESPMRATIHWFQLDNTEHTIGTSAHPHLSGSGQGQVACVLAGLLSRGCPLWTMALSSSRSFSLVSWVRQAFQQRTEFKNVFFFFWEPLKQGRVCVFQLAPSFCFTILPAPFCGSSPHIPSVASGLAPVSDLNCDDSCFILNKFIKIFF